MIVKGYKATDKNIKCRDYQFVVGQWHEHDGEVELCKSGFHFCPQPSGPWCYYSEEGTRIWEVEAEGVIQNNEPGADQKFVAHRIRLVREVVFTGDRNTGNYNTGYYNTGDYNTGYRNTGNYNTGDYNTGDCNTGNYNLTNNSSNFFAISEPTVQCFGVDTGLTRDKLLTKHGNKIAELYRTLTGKECDIDAATKRFSDVPGVSVESLQAWRDKYISLTSKQ